MGKAWTLVFVRVLAMHFRRLQWRNWLAHGTYRQYLSNAGVVSSSLTWSIFFLPISFFYFYLFYIIFNFLSYVLFLRLDQRSDFSFVTFCIIFCFVTSFALCRSLEIYSGVAKVCDEL